MGFNLHVIVLVFSLVFCIDDFGQCSSSCVARERHALVVFKNSLEDPTNILSSWVGQDCCKWAGITCDNTTRHVTVLSLSYVYDILVRGHIENEYLLASNEVNPSLAELTHLDVLDLSYINFKGSQIPEFFGNFTELTGLYLSAGGFAGVVPPSLGNLSTLTDLDLSYNELRVDSLNWLSPLTSLEDLRLSTCNCTGSQIPEFFGNFTELTGLYLIYGGFAGVVPPSLGNLSTLTALDLSDNELLRVDSLNWLSPLTSLEYLQLSYTNCTGSQIPEFFRNFTELTVLGLSGAGFEGVVPRSLGNLSTLTDLELSDNELLRVDNLNWLSPLTSLEYLVMGRVNLSLTSSHWPQVLRSFHYLSGLHLDNCELYEFPLSHINNSTLTTLYLSNNHFHGQFPSVFQNITSVQELNLDGNMFSGLIPSFVNDTLSRIYELDLSSNNFTGSVSNLCRIGFNNTRSYILSLDLSKNYFSGVIPSDCWSDSFPQGLFLGNNDFTGVIPSTFKPYYSLQLGQNRFHGELPLSLKESQDLKILDIGENQFSGNLPSWIGSLSSLRILNLRKNKFGGVLNPELCRLHNLQIVDVAENNFSGIIPACFKNFGGMKLNLTHNGDLYNLYLEGGNLVQVIKGVELVYTTALNYLFSLDLSSNNLDGSIPNELLSLTMLTSLNLSNNRLTGGIPKKIGDLNALESLDFSRNRLTGMIPQSIGNIFFLSVLNLSYNNLEGQIPSGRQLQLFESPSYAGNPALCGVPLEKKCSQKDSSQGTEEKMEKEYKVFESKEYYIGMALGIATGFWGLLLILLFKQTWRYTCFRFVENVYDLLFVK